MHTDSPAVPSSDSPLLPALRADLESSGWTVGAVAGLLSDSAQQALDQDQLLPATVELASVEAASRQVLLTRLFLLAEDLEPAEVAAALPALGVEGAQTLGLIGPAESGRLAALLDLRPHTAEVPGVAPQDWWVLSDLSPIQTGRPPREDHVLGIAQATTNLLRLTVRQPVESALDLGTGSGILALYLSLHAERVVATDISQRAAAFTRFNAALNGRDIDVRVGSLFEPVAGERFDLITSNPPFVISPSSTKTRLEYRDSGWRGDGLIPRIIRDSVGHLTTGGLLQMLANWEIHGTEAPWDSRVRAWLNGLSVDAWVAQRDRVPAAQYALWWLRDAYGEGRVPDAEFRAWLTDFAAAGITEVGLGFLALRPAPEGEQVVVCEDVSDTIAPDGFAVQRALENLAPLSAWGTDWQEVAYTRAADVREERYYVPGQADPELIRISQGAAGGRTRQVSSAVAALVGVSDGTLTPAQVLPIIADLSGEPVEQVVDQVAAALPELLRTGVLHRQ